MSTTGLAVLAIYLAGLVLAFGYRPIFGLYSYLWIFYNDPQTHWWGAELPDLRYSLTAGVVALIVALAMTNREESWSSSGGAKILLVFIAWCWIQTPWAVNTAVHLAGAILFTKYVVLSFVIWRVCSDERNIELFMWAHVAGCAIFGWEGFNANVAGRLETVGGPGVDDANLLAAHLITGLAIAGFMFVGMKGYKRWVLLAMIPFILNAIILTGSRGGFVALCAAAAAAVYLSPKIHRRMVIAASVLGGMLFLMLVNEDFWTRLNTITEVNAQNEGRLRMLGPQFQMFLDHPFGAGHRGNELLSPQYIPQGDIDVRSGTRSAHNTFIAALVDHGVPGAALLLLLYGWGIVTVKRLKRLEEVATLPPTLLIYRAGVGAALASLMVSGLFLNLLKTEVQIWLITLLASVAALSVRAAAGVRVEPSSSLTLQPSRVSAKSA